MYVLSSFRIIMFRNELAYMCAHIASVARAHLCVSQRNQEKKKYAERSSLTRRWLSRWPTHEKAILSISFVLRTLLFLINMLSRRTHADPHTHTKSNDHKNMRIQSALYDFLFVSPLSFFLVAQHSQIPHSVGYTFFRFIWLRPRLAFLCSGTMSWRWMMFMCRTPR